MYLSDAAGRRRRTTVFRGARAPPPPPSLSTPFHRGHARRPIDAPGHSPVCRVFRALPANTALRRRGRGYGYGGSTRSSRSRLSFKWVARRRPRRTDTTLIASRVSDPNQTAFLSDSRQPYRPRPSPIRFIITILSIINRCRAVQRRRTRFARVCDNRL